VSSHGSTPLPSGYEIGRARPDELARLPQIEERAAVLFDSVPWTACLPPYVTPLDDFVEAQREGLLWVARSLVDGPVGFALVEWLDAGQPHLEEVDVLPEHGRRGIGTALVRAVCDWAVSQGGSLSLTTFKGLPWNQPFYERLGFRVLSDAELSDSLAACVARETAAGLPREQRVVMRFDPLRT
jgi:GNAT superfamily N-acetyltransferase